MCLREIVVIALISLSIVVIGSFITYPAYARLAGALLFVSGLGLLALREKDIKSIREEGLEWNSGESAVLLGEPLVERKSKSKKWHRKKARRTKAK